MALVKFQFPIKSCHGRFEKDGMVFKRLDETNTNFTCNYRKSSLPATSAQTTARNHFKQLSAKVAEYKNNATTLTLLRTAYATQNKYNSFKKFLWRSAGIELGYYTNY